MVLCVWCGASNCGGHPHATIKEERAALGEARREQEAEDRELAMYAKLFRKGNA